MWQPREADAATAERANAEATRSVAALKAAPPVERVTHPAVATTHDNWYRVIREFQSRDHGLCLEDIGESATLDGAILLASSEIGRARVLSPWNRDKGRTTLFDNRQPIEARA